MISEITSNGIYHIVELLKKEIVFGYINSIQTVSKNVWKIKIHAKKTKELIITPNYCFLAKTKYPVQSILGFEKYLKKTLYNQKIHEIYQDKNNKVVCFALDKYNLIFEFFSKSNVILTDKDFKIITSKQKEEWKDRVIKKNEKYLFPSGKDLKLKTLEALENETKDLEHNEKIIYLSKTYNLAPAETNLYEKHKLLQKVFEVYKIEQPSFFKIEKNQKIILGITQNDAGETLFETLEKDFIKNFDLKEDKIKNLKEKKTKTIKIAQEEKRQQLLKDIETLEREGEFIYSNFTLIEEINKQINLAFEKKILPKEIEEKINLFFLKKNIDLEIKNIDQKTKSYELWVVKKK